jgi:hypothetical protein
MAQRRNLASKETNPAEAIDTLNARLRRKSKDAIRRSVEADLEKKSKRRRVSQAPATSAWKRGPS